MEIKYYYILSAVLSLVVGLVLKKKDRQKVDNKKLTLTQVLYSILLAYPFCLLYVWIKSLMEEL